MPTNPVTTALGDLRTNLGEKLFARVAGPEGPRRRDRIHGAVGPRWFEEDARIRQVHGDASMFVGASAPCCSSRCTPWRWPA